MTMTRKTFLTITALVATTVGLFALVAPSVLLEQVKMATSTPAAEVMARTVGVLLLTMGCLSWLVRDHEDSETLRAVLLANLVLQLAILPIDPLAWATGAFDTLGSWLPNTLLHVALAAGFAHYWLASRRSATREGATR